MSDDVDVKAIRATLKMTQAQFADAVGVCQGTVSIWEKTGQQPRRSVRLLIAMLQSRSAEAAQ